ncbi:MAG TPA: hypothetical protein VGJ00_08465 [Rhabdochlamydiaceae bacterium]|jgi:hypothetical protein
MEEIQIVWRELQKDLAFKFQGSRQLIADKSDHMIPWHQPDLIVQAIKELQLATFAE